MSEKQICLHCQTSLKAFTSTIDWKGRKYHKSCYNKIQKHHESVAWLKRMDMKYNTNYVEEYNKLTPKVK